MLVAMRLIAILALVLATGVAACGGGGDGGAEASSWDGPSFPYPDDGVLPVDGFRAHADAVDEDWERDPEALAREFTQMPGGDVTVEGDRVTLVRDDLEDDSVRAERYVLELERDG